ncbi:MAG: M50 family metallopeptidase [Acidobacteria bacterium]|nr:M50 family metallopeptidase [Acidobacteriota bacterium]
MLQKYRSFWTGLLFAPVGLAFGYIIGKALKGSAKDLQIGLAIIPITIIALWLVLAAHELGHVIGGRLAGFRFYLYAVGPLRIDGVNGSLEIKFNRNASLWGGIAAAGPDPHQVPEYEDLRKKMLMLVSGGPIVSLLGGLAFFPALAIWPSNQYLAAGLIVFAIGSLSIALVTMLPINNSGFVNDGARILQLASRNDAGRRWVWSAALGAISMSVRPRDWPAELVDSTTQNVEPTYDGIMAMWTRYGYHLDRQEFELARQWLDRALANVDAWPAAARPIIHAGAADFYARIEVDLKRARIHLGEANKPGFVTKEAVAVAESAVLVAEGKYPAARESLKLARKSLDSLSGSSRSSVEEILDQLEAKTH